MYSKLSWSDFGGKGRLNLNLHADFVLMTVGCQPLNAMWRLQTNQLAGRLCPWTLFLNSFVRYHQTRDRNFLLLTFLVLIIQAENSARKAVPSWGHRKGDHTAPIARAHYPQFLILNLFPTILVIYFYVAQPFNPNILPVPSPHFPLCHFSLFKLLRGRSAELVKRSLFLILTLFPWSWD